MKTFEYYYNRFLSEGMSDYDARQLAVEAMDFDEAMYNSPIRPEGADDSLPVNAQ